MSPWPANRARPCHSKAAISGPSKGTPRPTAWPGAAEPLVITVTLTIINPTTPLISAGGVVNNATFTPNLEPGGELTGGMYVAIFGQRLAVRTEQVSSVPFPTSLGGASVTMGGLPAPLVFVSATQIVCVVPQALTSSAAAAGVAQGAPPSTAPVVVIREIFWQIDKVLSVQLRRGIDNR